MPSAQQSPARVHGIHPSQRTLNLLRDFCASFAPVLLRLGRFPAVPSGLTALAGRRLSATIVACKSVQNPTQEAEGEGFEPSSEENPRNGFRDLGSSGGLLRSLAVSGGLKAGLIGPRCGR